MGLRSLARWLLEKRYHILGRLFGVPLPGDEGRPGAVIIQVDALGHQNLLAALEKGYMPHLRSLLESGRYTLQRWRCGLPSDTPPVQGGIMYGCNQDLVGFYWMDKATGRRINCANPPHAKHLEERIAAQGQPGILSQGSSYATILSGNAHKATFTVSRLDSYHFRNAYGLLGAFVFVLFKPPLFLTTTLHFIWDLVQETGDYLAALLTRRLRRREGLFPVTRAIINVVFREVATAGTIMDMFNGVPIIYTAYLGYDLVGHHTGPLSPNALRTLKGIDRAIGKIEGTRGWCRRRYDLFILSDHGMTPSLPFHLAYGQPLSAYIASVLGEGVTVEEYDADLYLGRDQLSPLSQDLQDLERHLPRLLALFVGRTRSLLGRSDGYHAPTEAGRITVIDCSPVAHLYLHGRPHRLGMAEVSQLYPDLIPRLVDHPGVGLVIGVEGDRVILLSRGGKATLGAECRVEGENPLGQFEEPEVAAREIFRLALMSHCGDLILFGALDGGLITCFQAQLGAHGSIGGDQFYPFFVHPTHIHLPLEHVTNAVELYPFFRRLAGNGG